jgi:hypothetical protein
MPERREGGKFEHLTHLSFKRMTALSRIDA